MAVKAAGLTRQTATKASGAYSLYYASPEQIKGTAKPDPRDDVHALGVIWYQMLVGDLTADAPRGAGWKKRLAAKGMPAEAVDLLEACVASEREDRPADGREVAGRLKAIGRPDDPPLELAPLELPPLELPPSGAHTAAKPRRTPRPDRAPENADGEFEDDIREQRTTLLRLRRWGKGFHKVWPWVAIVIASFFWYGLMTLAMEPSRHQTYTTPSTSYSSKDSYSSTGYGVKDDYSSPSTPTYYYSSGPPVGAVLLGLLFAVGVGLGYSFWRRGRKRAMRRRIAELAASLPRHPYMAGWSGNVNWYNADDVGRVIEALERAGRIRPA